MGRALGPRRAVYARLVMPGRAWPAVGHIAASGRALFPAGRHRAGGVRAQGMDAEEETGCPPLFEFASADDAQALDVIADAVLSIGDGGESARCAGALTLPSRSVGWLAGRPAPRAVPAVRPLARAARSLSCGGGPAGSAPLGAAGRAWSGTRCGVRYAAQRCRSVAG